jgi:glycosyltransferase involved in cell wall biosynthesis
MNFEVCIVMAVHNGASFLPEQIESLRSQTERDWRLLVRDDGSDDGSQEIIRNYCQGDDRIVFIEDGESEHSSASANFSILLRHAFRQGAEYVFCCDQDDVWEPRKLEAMLARIREVEGADKHPSLVHHDLVVVSDSLEPIADSFFDWMGLKPSDEQNPQRLISRNEVTGCAMACNRGLLDIALPIPPEAVMHDWWLALCAAYFGRLRAFTDCLVKYRQHGANVIGAKSFWHGLNPMTNWVEGWHRGNEEFLSTVRQAQAFRSSMWDRLNSDSEAYQALVSYGEFPSLARKERLLRLREFGLWRNNWLLDGILVLRMLLLPRNPGA